MSPILFNRNFFFWILPVLLMVTPAWSSERALTFANCFELARSRSESIGMSQADIKAARARQQRVLGHLLPVITGNASENLQDTSGVTPGTGINSNATRFSRPAASIGATQPLFQGFQEVHALKKAKLERRQKEWDLKETERALLAQVAVAFSDVARSSREIETTRRILTVGGSSLKQLREDTRLGKSRDAELKSLDAQVALLTAELHELKGRNQSARQRLSYLTGLEEIPSLSWAPQLRQPLKPLASYQAALQNRPDLKSAELATLGARHETGFRRGALLPQASVSANYYLYRTGFQNDINWDTTFNLAVPLMNISSWADVREALALQARQTLNEIQTKRAAGSDLKGLYENAKALRAQWHSLGQATGLSYEAFRLKKDDYQRGLTSHRDVLETMRSWMEILRTRDASELDAWLAAVSLMVASGERP